MIPLPHTDTIASSRNGHERRHVPDCREAGQQDARGDPRQIPREVELLAQRAAARITRKSTGSGQSGRRSPEFAENRWLMIAPCRVDTTGVSTGSPPTTGHFSTCASPIVPALNLRGMAIVAVLSLVLLFVFAPVRTLRPNGRMFFLGRRFHVAGDEERSAHGPALRLDLVRQFDRFRRDPGDDPFEQPLCARLQTAPTLAMVRAL